MSSFPDKERTEAKASEWLALRDNGFTPAEQREFEAWCAADAAHRAAVARLDAVWSALQQLRGFDSDVTTIAPRSRGAGVYRAIFFASGLAACAALAAVWWFRRPAGENAIPERIESHSYATVAGVYEKITLSDGSTVQLNGGTRLSIAFTTRERRVTLEAGEAHFAVVPNKVRPFRVAAAGTEVSAVGTAFNVRLRSEKIEVLVTEGRVQVARSHENLGSMTSRNEADSTPLLAAGEQMVVSRVAGISPTIVAMSPEEIRTELSWQVAKEAFVDMPLGAVVSRFNQRNRQQIEIVDPELVSQPVSGSFRTENLDGLLRLLESADLGVVVDRSEPDRIVLRRQR